MKKLYIASRYTTALYELNENGKCIIRDKEPITVDEAISLFKQNPVVKSFGILRAIIQEFSEETGWKLIESIIPEQNKPSIKEIVKRIPLKTRIFISLQMDDYDKWKNGEYLGDNDKLIKRTESILKDVFDWVDNGMPGGKDMDLEYFKTLKSTGLSSV